MSRPAYRTALFVDLDESGDAGLRFRQGSSRSFVVVLLCVEDPIPVQVAIDDLRRSLGFPPHAEFRFSHSSEDVRRRFLRQLRRYPVTIRALVVDKSSLAAPPRGARTRFYDRVLQLVLVEAGDLIADATLVLDESVKDKRRKRDQATFLRQALHLSPNAPRFRQIVHHASHTDSLVQAADMVCGAVYARFGRDDSSYLDIIRTKIDRLWVLEGEKL